MATLLELPDPRSFPHAGTPTRADAEVHAHVEARLARQASRDAEADDAVIDAALDARLAAGGDALARLLDTAPSAAVYRHLWRQLAGRERAALASDSLAVVLFALPLVVVAAQDAAASAALELAGTLPDPGAIARVLRENDALSGNVQFALSGALASADALDLRRIPAWIAQGRAALEDGAIEPIAITGASITVTDTQESVHLRFIVGSALCAPGADPLRDTHVGAWGAPLARALSRELARPGVTVLALPRAPERLVTALPSGRAAQREIALQLFVGNALRRMRGRVGEPSAVLSAHHASDAPGGGELRLSLSSPFDPRDAEGFRYPLQPHERMPDAIAALAALLDDCRVADVRALPGIHPDRDPATGRLRFFRGDSVEATRPMH
jgi:hypothetical protein